MKRKLGELLVEAGAVSREDVDAALAEQSAGEPSRLGDLLLAAGKVTPAALAQALAAQHGLPFTDLAYVAPEASDLIPLEFQRAHKVVPFRLDEEGGVKRAHVAIADPTLQEVVDELRTHLRVSVVVHVASLEDVESVHAALSGEALPGTVLEGGVIDDVEVELTDAPDSAELPPVMGTPVDDLFGSELPEVTAEAPPPVDSDPFSELGLPELAPLSPLEVTVPMRVSELPPSVRAPEEDPLAAFDLAEETPAFAPPEPEPVVDLGPDGPDLDAALDAGLAEAGAPIPQADAAAALADDVALQMAMAEPEALGAPLPGGDAFALDAIGAVAELPRPGPPAMADALFSDLEPVSSEPLTPDLAEAIGSGTGTVVPKTLTAPEILAAALTPAAAPLPPLPKVALSPPPPVVPRHGSIPSIAILPEDPLFPDLSPAPVPRPPEPRPAPASAVVARIALKRVAVVADPSGGPARTIEVPRGAPTPDGAGLAALAEAAARAEAAAKAEAEIEAAAKAEIEAAAKAQADAEAAAKAEIEAAAKAQAEIEAAAAAKAEIEAAAKAQADAEAAAKPKAEPEVPGKPKTEAEIRAKAKADAEARAKAKFEAEAAARQKSKAEAAAKAKAEAEATARARAEAQAAAKAKADAEAAEAAKVEAEAARAREAEAAKARAELEAVEAAAKAEAEAAVKAEEEAAARAEAALAELGKAEAAAAAVSAEPAPEPKPASELVFNPELSQTVETQLPAGVDFGAEPPAEQVERPLDGFVLPDWMKVPAEAPKAWVDPNATVGSGLKRLLDEIARAQPSEQGRLLAALVKLLVERGLLDEKEVLAALAHP